MTTEWNDNGEQKTRYDLLHVIPAQPGWVHVTAYWVREDDGSRAAELHFEPVVAWGLARGAPAELMPLVRDDGTFTGRAARSLGVPTDADEHVALLAPGEKLEDVERIALLEQWKRDDAQRNEQRKKRWADEEARRASRKKPT